MYISVFYTITVSIMIGIAMYIDYRNEKNDKKREED